jgi:hypothetical protein
MATKERIHQLVDAMPDGPETDLQLDDIEHKLEPNGLSDGTNGATPSTSKLNRGRDFLISVARGTSGLDLDSLRTVRER